MSRYIDPYILIILGILICDYNFSDLNAIIILLCSVIIVSLLTLIKHEKTRFIILIISSLIVCFFPQALPFLPAIVYWGFYSKKYLPTGGIFLLAVGITVTNFSLSTVGVLALGLLSGYIAHMSQRHDELIQKTKELRDNSTEREIILNQKNKQLLEMQHDQIHLATLTERNRIAREIHDNVGHMLSRAIIQVGAITAVTKDEQIKPLLSSLKETLDEAMNNIRTSVHDLHNESIDLENSIQGICNEYNFCPVELQCDTGDNIPKDIKYCFITIVKEALNNTAKHSNATKASIYIHEHPGFYQLLIEDNGTTGSEDPINSASAGIGLVNMQDRVKALGGIINISCNPGFRIYISIPKKN